MQNKSCVYWIHTPEQTDIFSQGYIGISVGGPEKRMKEHRCAAKAGSTLPVHNAMRKYGDIFKMDVVVYAEPGYCRELEAKLRPEPNIGYNVSVGGGHTNLGSTRSVETKSKISKAGKGRVCSEHTRQLHVKNSTGRLHTDEVRAKISKSQKELSRDLSGIIALAAKRNSELPPWKNPASCEKVWISAVDIYNYMVENPCDGQKKIGKKLGFVYSQLLVIYKKIRSGWNPNTDAEWLIFSGKLTPDYAGDKSLNPAIADNQIKGNKL